MSDTFMGAGLSAGLGAGPDRAIGLFSAAEQLRHVSGRVFTAIRPIAQALARLPFKVAEHVGVPKAKKSFAISVLKQYSGRVSDRSMGYHWKARCKALERKMPEYLKNKVEELEVLEMHPFLDALADPNPIQVLWHVISVTVYHLEACGISYWWFMPEGRGRYHILPLPPSWVTPVHKPKLFDHYEVRVPGSAMSIDVPTELIVPFYYPSPQNPLGRFSPLQAMSRTVVADESISEAQYKAFRNGIFPGLMVKIGRHPDIQGAPGTAQRPMLTTAQRQEIMTWIRTAYRGVTRADEPIIADALIEDVTPVTKTNREMDFMKSADVTQKRIDQGFGTSPVILGDIEASTYAASSVAEDHFATWTVNPKGELFGQSLTKWAMPLYNDGNQKLICYQEKAKAENPEEQRLDEAFLVANACRSRNDILADRGLPPVQGGDSALVDASKVLFPVARVGEDMDFPEDDMNPLAKPPQPDLTAVGDGNKPADKLPPNESPAKPAKPEGDSSKDVWRLLPRKEKAAIRGQQRLLESLRT